MRQRFSAFRPAAFDHGEPISRTTSGPIAAVLLVVSAIVMLGLPVKTHAIIIDLPPSVIVNPPAGYVQPPRNRVSVSRTGQVGWNGESVNLSQLMDRLDRSRNDPTHVGLIFDPADDARYGDVLPALGIVKRMGLAESSFCIAGLYRNRQYELPVLSLDSPRNSTFSADAFPAEIECEPDLAIPPYLWD